MKVKTRSTGFVIAIGLGVALLASAAYVAVGGVRAVAGRSLVAAQPAALGDAVMEWNQQAATRTLSASPALAPVQQTRVMAIAQVAVHAAVNGITGEYATYLSPGPAPAGA